MNKETTWVPQVPVPNDAPAPTLEHRFLGKPAAAYCYKTKVGETAGYICRFNTGDGAKEFRPYSYGSIDGIPGWHWKGLSEAIPLYNVNQLTNRSDAPVLVVEGEKTADAAASYFPDFVVVTTMFGAKSPGKSDWTALEGREVLFGQTMTKPERPMPSASANSS